MAGRRLSAGAVATLVALLAGCASRPPIDAAGARLDLPPYVSAEHGAGDAELVWGGMIVEVHNLADHSEVVVLAYPLDRRLRPRLDAPTEGRFIVVVPGYLEALDWPQGRFLSARGRQVGVREVSVGEHAYAHPLLEIRDLHLWPADFRRRGPRISIGVGVGIR